MSRGERTRWSIVQEASAFKAGNVHPLIGFDNMDFARFVAAAEAIGDAIDRSTALSLGQLVVQCTRAMLDVTGVNTSLGTILLLAPLIQYEIQCEQTSDECLRSQMLRPEWTGNSIQQWLQATSFEDSSQIYRAIASCKPGGMGSSQSMDILGPPPDSILKAMRLAAEHDDVALQYCNGYLEVARYARYLVSPEYRAMSLADAIRRLQLVILAERVDSLIARKCGLTVGREVQSRAGILMRSTYGSALFEAEWKAFDEFLRSDGNRRNPGTTADLIATALYVASDVWM